MEKYYIYENWTAYKKAKIHYGSCSYCRDGQGRTAHKPLGDKNGSWHGPYESLTQAIDFASKNCADKVISKCKHCLGE